MSRLETKSQKINYIISELKRLDGLEFISKDEISAMNYACRILRNYQKNLKEEVNISTKQYIINCPVNKVCIGCYRESVCKEDKKG